MRDLFVTQSGAFEQALAGQQDLAGVDGLGEVVADLAAEGFFHQVLFLALGDHHHGQVGRGLFDFGERLKAAHAGHLLVEQHHVEAALLDLFDGVGAVGNAGDGVAFVLSQILVVVALGGTLSVAERIGDFVSVFVGGVLIGGAIGVVAVLLLPLLGRLPAAAMSIAVAYGSYVTADSVLGFSGVMATVAAGVVMGSMTESRANREVREILHEFWDAL